ncbi:tyrosine--tRNA ligase [Rhizobium ruizarguesonis]|nr:tyrosine--tRNA ligase [Rhizobium ruizarguesonis]
MEALDSWLCSGAGTAYNGFDLTADSLHVGHLIPIMMLRWFQKTGNKPIALLGGATSRLGDPSFRDTSRPFLSQEQIMKNLIGIRRVFERFLAFGDGPTDAVMVNNADWLGGLNYLYFLRDIGPHFLVNRMLTSESVRQRLEREQSLSLLEFNYMVMQAYDFHVLAESRGCLLQLGGSDQWGNIVSGVEFGRRIGGRALFGLTAPLLTTSSGAKMGKSVSGAVWLNADRLSPYEFWQFWRNAGDADVGRFLRLFTELPLRHASKCFGIPRSTKRKRSLPTRSRACATGQMRQRKLPKPPGALSKRAKSRLVCRQSDYRIAFAAIFRLSTPWLLPGSPSRKAKRGD